MTQKIIFKLVAVLVVCLQYTALHAMTYDNRFFPLFPPARFKPGGLLASWTIDAIVATSSIAIANTDNQKEIGIPEIFGLLDEGALGTALSKVGKKNPLPSEWHMRGIPVFVEGKQQFEGLTMSAYQPIGDWIIAGGSIVFLRANARHDFNFRDRSNDSLVENLALHITADDQLRLQADLRTMFTELALQENQSAQVGFGDLDLFVGIRHTWEVACKCRRIDADLCFGMIAPTGLRQNLDIPASIPFGADGHWGVYINAQGLFEIKEDIKLSLTGRVIKRISRTMLQRLSVEGEPSIFGATVGLVERDPGFTFVFCPFLSVEYLRGGLGLGLGYTFVHHCRDRYKDKRPSTIQEMLPVKLEQMEKLSIWGSSYFTLAAFYELDWIAPSDRLIPTISVSWDIPATLFSTGGFVKTNALYAGVEFSF